MCKIMVSPIEAINTWVCVLGGWVDVGVCLGVCVCGGGGCVCVCVCVIERGHNFNSGVASGCGARGKKLKWRPPSVERK